MYTPQQLRKGDLHWLLVLTLRGQVYRFSERVLAVDDDGTTLLFHAGLAELEYVDAIAEPGSALEERSIGVEVLFGAGSSDGWATIAAADIDLGDATAELSLWLEGQGYASREVILSGRIEAPSFGYPGEQVSFEISESPWTANATRFPPSDAVIDTATWPRTSNAGTHMIGQNASGQPYPWVFGSPGRTDPDGNTYPAMSLPLVEIDDTSEDNATRAAHFLLGGTALACAGVASSVQLWNRTQEDGASPWADPGYTTPLLAQDRLGRVVTIVSIPAAGELVENGDEVYAAFVDADDGGTIAADGGTMRAVTEIIAYLLGSFSSVRADVAAIEAALPELRGYLLDFVVNEQIDPLDLLMDDILPLIPAVWRVGPQGLHLVPWRWRATAKDATFRIDHTRMGGDFIAPVQVTGAQEVTNHQRIEFAVDMEDDRYRGQIAFAPYPKTADTAREVHPFARASATRYGERRGSDLSSDYVMDRPTARACLDWRLKWYAHPRATFSYVLPQEYQAVRPGDVGVVTHADLGWTERPVIALSVVRRPGDTEIALTTIPDWVADAST